MKQWLCNGVGEGVSCEPEHAGSCRSVKGFHLFPYEQWEAIENFRPRKAWPDLRFTKHPQAAGGGASARPLHPFCEEAGGSDQDWGKRGRESIAS